MSCIDRLEVEIHNPNGRNLFQELKMKKSFFNLDVGMYEIKHSAYTSRYKWMPYGLKLVLNPNHFDKHLTLRNWAEDLLELKLHGNKITRIDLNCDLNQKFEIIRDTLDVMYKRNTEAFSHKSKGGETDGLHFGGVKSHSRVSVYLHEVDEEIDSPSSGFGVTRIERKLIKTAIPSKNWDALKEALLAQKFEAFPHIRFITTEILASSERSEENRIKKAVFLELKDVFGYSQAKKRKSKGGHFYRKYKDVFKFQPIDISLNNLWREEAIHYFSE